jgi:hypothetical protein
MSRKFLAVATLLIGQLACIARIAIAQDLQGLSSSDRISLEAACSLAETQGPASYHACERQQLAHLGNDKAPDLQGLSSSDRISLEAACSLAETQGPASYHACERQQLAHLGNNPAAANSKPATRSDTSTSLSNNNYYTNSDGNRVHSPARSSNGAPAGATAICGDGTYSFSQHRQGTCSHHGGVSSWL